MAIRKQFIFLISLAIVSSRRMTEQLELDILALENDKSNISADAIMSPPWNLKPRVEDLGQNTYYSDASHKVVGCEEVDVMVKIVQPQDDGELNELKREFDFHREVRDKQLIIPGIVRMYARFPKGEVQVKQNVYMMFEHPMRVGEADPSSAGDVGKLRGLYHKYAPAQLDYFLGVKRGADQGKRLALMISQLSWGLYQMHKKNILHRNIKPQNIFMARDGTRFKLGNSRITDPAVYDAVDATMWFRFLPPEVLGVDQNLLKDTPREDYRNRLLPAGDVWALGVSLATLVYRNSNGHQVAHPYVYELMTRLIETHGIPEELKDLLMRMMDDEKTNRPSAEESWQIAFGLLSKKEQHDFWLGMDETLPPCFKESVAA